jgi:trehalose 6-phosphate phosphatase
MHTDPTSRAESIARVRKVAGALRRLFASRPAGLLTDVDGTISQLTTHAMAATVSDRARRALDQLTSELELVAVVTGRAVERAQQMVGVTGLAYVGNHGLEWLQDGAVQRHPAAISARPALEAATAAIRAAIPDPGLVYEDKGASVAVHYRLTAEPQQVERRLHTVLAPHVQGGGVRLIEGVLVVNLLPAIAVDKGAATRRLVEQHGLRSVAFFGDDVTDLYAFRELQTLRASGSVDALTIGVVGPEAPPEVAAEADLLLEGVGEVERVLGALAARPPAR